MALVLSPRPWRLNCQLSVGPFEKESATDSLEAILPGELPKHEFTDPCGSPATAASVR